MVDCSRIMKHYIFIFILFLTIAANHREAISHPGGLDKNGCHHDGREYHCHGQGSGSAQNGISNSANDKLRFIRMMESLPSGPEKPRNEYEKAMDIFRQQRGEKLQNNSQKHNEAHYQKIWCNQQSGIIEVVIPNGRIDCLTATHAVEVDFMKKWAESIGQALFYSKSTSKKAGILLIIDQTTDTGKLNNIRKTIEANGVDLWTINK